MSEEADFERDRSLFDLWRAHARPVVRPDPMLLAAYAEGRLDEADAAAVEAALAGDPALLDDVLEARRSVAASPATKAVVSRAQAIRPGPSGRVVELLPRRPRSARLVAGLIAWGAVAASVLLVSFVGFHLGVQTQRAFDAPAGSTAVDLLGSGEGVIG